MRFTRDRRAPLWTLPAAVLLAASCGTAPLVGDLGFGLVIDNGAAVVKGQVVSTSVEPPPDGQQAPPGRFRLTTVPLVGVSVDLVDRVGQPVRTVAAVNTDDTGRFSLPGPRIGEPGYLRVSYNSAGPRSLFAFVRPETEIVCADISLMTTILARAIASSDTLPDTFDTESTRGLTDAIAESLPEILVTHLGGSLDHPITAAEAQVGLDDIVLADKLLPATGGPPLPGQALVDKVLKQPAIEGALSAAQSAFLQVTFTVKAVGTNTAPYAGLRAVRHLMRGNVKLQCIMPGDAGAYEDLGFWLNNALAVEGTLTDGAWRARMDTRSFPDGPYVLSAMVRLRGHADGVAITKSFVYLDNRQRLPIGCGEVVP